MAICRARNYNERYYGRGIPPEAMDSMTKRYPMPWSELTPTVQGGPWEPYVPDTTLPAAWVFDIDGTLSELAPGYSPYDPAHYLHDTPNLPVVSALRGCWSIGDFVVLLSGREGTKQGRADTEEWLAKHDISWDGLYMRPEGDDRPDQIVKSELFDKYL